MASNLRGSYHMIAAKSTLVRLLAPFLSSTHVLCWHLLCLIIWLLSHHICWHWHLLYYLMPRSLLSTGTSAFLLFSPLLLWHHLCLILLSSPATNKDPHTAISWLVLADVATFLAILLTTAITWLILAHCTLVLASCCYPPILGMPELVSYQ